MRQINSFLFVSMLFVSCEQPHSASTTEDSSHPLSPAEHKSWQSSNMQRPGDPTFIMSKDTTSLYGPTSITRNMLQDKNGNMWFATWQGIICYDGKFFTNMTLKAGLDHYHASSLLEDRRGNLWFGTMGGGIYKYDGKAFIHFKSTDGLAGNTVFSILEDRTGKIWLGTASGLSCYDGRIFTNFSRRDGLIHDSVYSVAQDKNGKLWFGTEGGINSMYDPTSGGTGKLSREEQLSFRHVTGLLSDSRGDIWIGCQAGLCYYNPSAKALSMITKTFVPNLLEGRDGSIWLAGDVHRYDGQSLIHYNLMEGQNSNNLFCLFEDRNGNLWFGSMNGIRRYDGNPLPEGKGNFTEFRETASGN